MLLRLYFLSILSAFILSLVSLFLIIFFQNPYEADWKIFTLFFLSLFLVLFFLFTFFFSFLKRKFLKKKIDINSSFLEGLLSAGTLISILGLQLLRILTFWNTTLVCFIFLLFYLIYKAR